MNDDDEDLSMDSIRTKVQSRIGEMLQSGFSESDIRAAMPQIQEQINERLSVRRGRAAGPWKEEYRVAPAGIRSPKEEPAIRDARIQRQMAAGTTPDQTVGEKLRAALHGVPEDAGAYVQEGLNQYTGGIYPALTDAVGLSTPGGRQAVRDKSPEASSIGSNVGIALGGMGGIPAAAGAVGGQIARRVAPRIAESALGRFGINVASGGGSEGALNYATTGDIDSAQQAAEIGALGAAAPTAAAGLMRGARAIPQLSPHVAGFAKARTAGRLPQAEAFPSGRKGIEDASIVARDRVLERDDVLTAAAGAKYQAGFTPELPKPGDRMAVDQKLLDLALTARVPSTGVVSNQSLLEGIGEIKRQVGKNPTIEDLKHIQAGLHESADFGNPAPATPEVKAARKAYLALRAGIHEGSDVVKDLDASHTAFKQNQSRRGDMIFRSEEGGRSVDLPPPVSAEVADGLPAEPLRKNMRVNDEIKGATFFERVGDDSVIAGRNRPYYKELAAQDPVGPGSFGDVMADMEAKKSLEATRFGLSGTLQTNLDKATGLGGYLNAGTQNVRAIARRLDDLPLRGLQHVADKANAAPVGRKVAIAKLIAAREKEKEKEAERARVLREKRGD